MDASILKFEVLCEAVAILHLVQTLNRMIPSHGYRNEKIVDLKNLSADELDVAMRALPPQARIALETMAQLQNRPAEDVLRDEIRQYIAGRIPIVNLEAAIEAIQSTAHTAGYLIGRLRRFAREMNNE